MSYKMIVPDLGEDTLSRLRTAVPEMTFLVAQNKEEALTLAPEVDAIYTFCTPELLAAAPNLKWVQALSAGVERYPFDELEKRGIIFTNASGVYGAHLADHLMAFILAFSRQLPVLFQAQQAHDWKSRKTYPPGDLRGQTLLIDGLGGTGQDLAQRAKGFDMRVIATRRHLDRPKPDTVEAVYAHDQLRNVLPEADWVAVCVPLTDETRDRYHNAEFALMKNTAYITNIARGKIINTDALMNALDNKQIAGAGLDVTDPEPLPTDHPLWDYENVIITPHASGHSPNADENILNLICENAQRFVKGKPLKNQVHLNLRY
ncbi:MAG: D-2-hydroxyacid dehydrogenase [Candidatus Latescibacteria bacterium]|jgi:phosphoglycerate dehydrogenase-like enzyme|nr:D-2-hydroxyacid dehydrogenase [Candidatus Latescibacterota bacterium]MBT5833094.1 D-2-hydroxyacid dehydrogenase [Candidatus Latescibacterota bacterium]